MARRIQLTDFQRSLLDRLAIAAEREVAVSNRLGVACGSEHWLLRLDQAGEILFLPEIQEVPLTRPWFRGVANVRGHLVGVVDWSEFRGDVPTPFTYRTRLVLFSERLALAGGLLVGHVAGLRSVDDMQPESPQALDTATQNDEPTWAGARYRDHDGQVWRELDMAALVREPAFLNIATA
jgi:twitching motility protein PilI